MISPLYFLNVLSVFNLMSIIPITLVYLTTQTLSSQTFLLYFLLLRKVSGYEFYNTSKYTFEKLLDEPDNIEENFHNYLNGFSDYPYYLSIFNYSNIIKPNISTLFPAKLSGYIRDYSWPMSVS